jgi:S-adenosylmethionine hydrolase
MENSRIITLLTDFGLKDPFAGIMKGVIYRINPDAVLVDITHDVRPHDILEAALVLWSAYRYFPRGTIHLVVVDPGVGSRRRPVLAETADYCFVAPDNGVLSKVYSDPDFKRVVEITLTEFFLEEVSRTFHGRDIFAPVASWLSKGKEVSAFGREIDDFVKIAIPEPEILDSHRIKGEIIYVDRFGNLVSNIPQSLYEKNVSSSRRGIVITLGLFEIRKIVRSYLDGEKEKASALFNSWGHLEIFVPWKSASKALDMGEGQEITVAFI